MAKLITIRFDDSEYRVPTNKGDATSDEAGAYYTDDRDDAIATARAVWGDDVKLVFWNVEFADPGYPQDD